MELELLEKSFTLDESNFSSMVASLRFDDEDDEDTIHLDSKQSETLRLAMEDYIKERKAIYEDQITPLSIDGRNVKNY